MQQQFVIKINKKISTLFFWLFLLICFNGNSQNYYESYLSLKNTTPRHKLEAVVDSLINLANLKEDVKNPIKIAHDFYIQLYKKRDFVRALKYALIEIKYLERNGNFGKSYSNALYNSGRFYFYNNEFENAIEQYRKVIELRNYEKKIGDSYGEIARCYTSLGLFYKSIEYFKKGIRLLEKKNEYRSLFSLYLNLAVNYRYIGDKESFNKGINLLNKAKKLSIHLNFTKNIHLLSNLYVTYANFYSEGVDSNFIKAKLYYLKNEKIGLKLNDSLKISFIYNNLANLYNTFKRDSAKYYLEKGFKYVKNKETNARLYDNESEYYIIRHQYKQALTSINKALEINLGISLAKEKIPNKLELTNSELKEHTLFCLKKKTEILLKIYKQGRHKKFLKSAINQAKAADNLVTILLESSSENKTKLFWRKQASEVYLKGVYAAFLLKDTKTIFYFMEKNKALLLTESIAKNTRQSILPKNISAKDLEFKKRILTLESKPEKNKQDALQDSLFTIKRAYEKYTDSIKVIYPKYFKNQLNIAQIPISEVQENLKKNEVVISYIWNKFDDETALVFGLVIAKNKAEIFKINSVVALKENLNTYKKLVSKPFETKRQQAAFQKVSHTLYKQLFPKDEVRNLLANRNVVIIPDGDLQNIPFDALITKENTFEYLLNSSTISYVYSMSFLKYNNKVIRKTTSNYIGYSPSSFQKLNLENLSNTKEEITTIQNTIGGNIIFNDAANKSHFLRESSTSKIIHLATHADATQNPWIAFYDKKLELHELYTYKNNADLVVLSACNTSIGEVAVGEGVLSLARGFFYAGAKSVISSLWNVNDKSSSFIMKSFYKNIKSGQTKAEALTNSKREYLKTHSLSEQSPYYWSTFLLIGDANTVDLPNYNFFYITLLFILIIGFILFFKKKNTILG
jgi:CHAT domain-containing protein